MKPWDVKGKWSVSHFCYADAVRKQMALLPRKVSIRDVTFREGDDQPGYRVSVEDKIELLRIAVEMGIQEIDIGGPSMGQHHYDLAKAARDSGIKVRKTGRFFGNNTKDFRRDVDICMEAGSDNLRVVFMYLNEETVLKQLSQFPEICDYVHSQHQTKISWAISDTPRAPLELIRKVYRDGFAAGGDKAGVNDTFGVANPAVMRYLSAEIRSIIPEDMVLKAHCHNTYGIATANSLACVEGGADEVDCTINGYGDEAGNAALEEVVTSLEALYGVDTGLKLETLYRYSQAAIKKGRTPLQPHKAVVGENAFLRPMYIWNEIDMAKESWMLHEPLSPHAVGAKSSVVFGPEGSLDDKPIETKLKELGIPCTPTDIVRIRETVEKMLLEEQTVKIRRKYVTELEFEDICKQLARGPKA